MTIQTSEPVLPVLYADFNDIGMGGCERRGCLPVLPEAWRLVPGQKVILTDHEGNRCEGRVRHIHLAYVGVHAHLSTWQDGGVVA